MRKEADDIGPTAELEHWKERMAKFNVYVHKKKLLNLGVAVLLIWFGSMGHNS